MTKEQVVEKLAQLLCKRDSFGFIWENQTDATKQRYRDTARAVLAELKAMGGGGAARAD